MSGARALGRIFRVREGMTFEIRGEFYNAFNRTEMNNPVSTNALATRVVNAQGLVTAGFGYVNGPGGLSVAPRNGQLIARFQF